MLRRIAFVPLLLAPFCLAQAGLSDDPTTTPSDFVRFVKQGDGGHLDTAITTYRKGDVEVILFGAVHIADEACYQLLNDRFTACDALLYELVAPPDHRPDKDREIGVDPLTLLQMGMRNSMELTFQLDVIDYQPENFVHADMTPEEFKQSMKERGESLISIMFDMMMGGLKMQRDKLDSGEAEAAPQFDLVQSFRSGEGRHALRMMLASQLEEMEALAAGAKPGGSTLLEGRNEKCLDVLEQQMRKGRKKIGIYYGAAHLPHMERRMVADLGFTKVDHEWLVAWDCAPRPDPKFDRELAKLRRQCKKDLAVLAEAAREYRREVKPEAVVTVAEIATAEKDGASRYAGPRQDPWGLDFVIEQRKVGVRWQVRSAGQDGELGTGDDIVVQEPRLGGLKIF